MAITKSDVEKWIKEIVPYVINPVILAPKGMMSKGLRNVKPGSLVEYDTCLMPGEPNVMDKTPALKALIGLYSLADEDISDEEDISNILFAKEEDENIDNITLDDEFENSDMVI